MGCHAAVARVVGRENARELLVAAIDWDALCARGRGTHAGMDSIECLKFAALAAGGRKKG